MINDRDFPELSTYFGGYDDFDIASWSGEELMYEYECLQENCYRISEKKSKLEAKLLDYQDFVKDLSGILLVQFDSDCNVLDSLTAKEKITIFRRAEVTLQENKMLNEEVYNG
tara:strand:- start:152 stop:490 length:339 start_codon:yes stop_codon:yes gene_type:complete